MRWIYMILLCVVLQTVTAAPEPKKYKAEPADKDKKGLTDDEKKFLREVEEKFGIKSDVPVDAKKTEVNIKGHNETVTNDGQKPPFPAVIAIEIVNDTETNSKGKRTIDANLGYGYRTNNGYSYSYFGKPAHEKGKFMIYPYSQEDIPAGNSHHGHSYSSGKHATSVEIQPSRAFELVSVKDEQNGYDYNPPANPLSYDHGNTQGSYTKTAHPSTLYTTYNGESFSGLSGQFPTIMPNYFVDPSQLLKNPQYQSVGLTPEHLRTQGSPLEQRVVPVLVLRIPSSYLKNPTAELYANLPNNYPLSQHLNSVNLQELVNQYFKKNGYSFAPQVMAYQSPVSTAQSVVSNHEQTHYANPYVQPAYTHADYSGVQYSAVKPVMARYPLSYSQQKYLVAQNTKSLYQRPLQQQHYEYQYQYVPSTAQPQQTYYVQPQQYKTETAAAANHYQNDQSTVEHQAGLHDAVTSVEYRNPQHAVSQEAKVTSVEYEAPQNTAHGTHQSIPSYYESPNAETAQYSQEDSSAYAPQQTVHSAQVQPDYSSDYYSAKQTGDKQTVSVYPSQLIHSENYQEHSNENAQQQYVYQSQNSDAGHGLVLTENYPTKDHTIATVLPYTYSQSRKPSEATIQTVSYVTPMPSSQYQSKYKIMVPQTVLKNSNSEKVSYVNSHSAPTQYFQPSHYSQEGSAEQEYSLGTQYVPQVATKSSYSRNHHAHPKRQAKPDNKAAASTTTTTTIRKQAQKSDKKNSA